MAQAQKTQTLNGIDVSQLQVNIDKLRQDPTLARFVFRGENHWQTAGHNQTTFRGFHGTNQEHTHDQPFELKSDEPRLLAGDETDPNPVEHLLNALAACLTNSLAYHAAVQGIEIHAIDSSLEGDIDMQGFLNLKPEVGPEYQQIRVTMRVKSDAQVEQLKHLAEFSPVYNTVRKPVQVELQIEKAA